MINFRLGILGNLIAAAIFVESGTQTLFWGARSSAPGRYYDFFRFKR